MKRQFLYTLALLLFGIGALKAQTIPATNSQQCLSCVPPGWTGFSTPAGHLPSVSDKTEYGIGGPYITNVPNTDIVSYNWVSPLPAPTSGHLTFLSINNTELVKTSASTIITGLIPGAIYKINASVSTREIFYGHQLINGNIITKTSAHGKTAKLTLSNGASGSAEFDFSVNNYNGTIGKWHPLTLKFTATASQATLTFSGTGQNPALEKDSPQIINLDLAAVPIERICSNEQIKLTSNTWSPCPGTTENLMDPSHYYEVPVGTPANIPSNFEVRVFDNPNHTGNPVTTTTKNGTFYYFFYDKDNLCYNTNNSTAKLTVTFQGEQQVFINTAQIFNTCTGTTANLNPTVTPTQSNNTIVWFISPQHLGTQISNPEAVGAGTYYAFYKNPTGCFLTHNSIAKVVVNVPNQEQVSLKGGTITKLCPSEKANLNEMINGPIPAGTEVRWFTNKNHQGAAVTDPTAVGVGSYYPFLFDVVNQCYKTVQSGFSVSVGIVPEAQVQLNLVTVNNACPSTAVDLTKSISSAVPAGWKVVWYQNNVHSGAQVKNPAAVSSSGSYYAFFYNTNTSCFQTVTSTSKLDVKISRCDLAPTQITLNAKVFLQGAMQQDTMHNQLQTYFKDGTGLLPISDPYDGSSTYDDIYNVQGVAGTVVDWVRVEIRNGFVPSFMLEAKNLLLKTDGKIVDIEGKEPIFAFQSIPVRVVVKHRNHLPVMSNALNFTNKSVACDFTTSLPQAFKKEIDDPAQMIQVNGVWCMWAGDVNEEPDMGVDATDYNTVFFSNSSTPFDVYIREDLNLDGGVDVTDLNILFFNNGFTPYSTILHY